MNHPYQPPDSPIRDTRSRRRLAHCLAAFVAGMTIPPLLLFACTRLAFGFDLTHVGSPPFWWQVTLGSLLAAAAVYRHRRLPLAWAAAIGAATVGLLLGAPYVWEIILG